MAPRWGRWAQIQDQPSKHKPNSTVPPRHAFISSKICEWAWYQYCSLLWPWLTVLLSPFTKLGFKQSSLLINWPKPILVDNSKVSSEYLAVYVIIISVLGQSVCVLNEMGGRRDWAIFKQKNPFFCSSFPMPTTGSVLQWHRLASCIQWGRCTEKNKPSKINRFGLVMVINVLHLNNVPLLFRSTLNLPWSKA